MTERSTYYARNNSVITTFLKHCCILTVLRHFRSCFGGYYSLSRRYYALLFRLKRASYYASELPLVHYLTPASVLRHSLSTHCL